MLAVVLQPRVQSAHSLTCAVHRGHLTADPCAYMQVMYNAMTENNCSEQASRMSAMESSTKNASEMLEKLTLSYNR